MNRNNVLLVDHHDVVVGEMEKLEAHKQGKLHRAFSVFIFNDKGELLLQQRARKKYHGGELWTNTCCSHPQLGENILSGATERLAFEMGLQCDLEFLFSFVYRASVENDLIENEFDHVFIGHSNLMPHINKEEVQDYRWAQIGDISSEIIEHPERYTYWFRMALPQIIPYLSGKLHGAE